MSSQTCIVRLAHSCCSCERLCQRTATSTWLRTVLSPVVGSRYCTISIPPRASLRVACRMASSGLMSPDATCVTAHELSR